MSFLPAIPLPSIKGHVGFGGIAANIDGTLIASVDSERHCVHIYRVNSAGELTADPVVVGGFLSFPWDACFVRRGGVDSLLICDLSNRRVVETTVAGVFLRAISVESSPCSIAYCSLNGVIAVSGTTQHHSVMLVEYASGNTMVIIGTGTKIT